LARITSGSSSAPRASGDGGPGAQASDLWSAGDLEPSAVTLHESLDIERIAPVGQLDERRLGGVCRAEPNGASRAGLEEHDVDLEDRRIAARIRQPEHQVRRFVA
jgi:hypothetical protein